MDPNISFAELARLQREQLAKQRPFTLYMMRAQSLRGRNEEMFLEKFGPFSSWEESTDAVAKILEGISHQEYFDLMELFSIGKFDRRKR